jgi:mono/diheme cytochrome c family protein
MMPPPQVWEKLMRTPIRIVAAAIGVLFLIGAVAIAYTYSGLQDVAADGEHRPLTAWLLGTVRRHSVSRAAGEIEARLPEPFTEALQHEAVVGYESMCAACHAPPGAEPTALARGLNPAAPELAELATRRTPGELFWATRHGIRMTGMPAWGITHSDEELWPLVALVLRFPEMADDEYAMLLAAAHEAGVETAASCRGRGYAAPVVAAWARAVRDVGRVPLYSTSWRNEASRAVARKLGLVCFGSDLHIT